MGIKFLCPARSQLFSVFIVMVCPFYLSITVISEFRLILLFCHPITHLLFLPLTVCQRPYQPENGGFTCHPFPCQRLSHGTVIEYFCNEGYILKGDYKYLTCQYGEWDSQMKLSCIMKQGDDKKMDFS